MPAHELTLSLGTPADLEWAQQVVVSSHYLHSRVHRQARPAAYVIRNAAGLRCGLIIVGLPHATRNRGWWGYPGLPTQWQVVDLSRIWLDARLQQGGEWCCAGIAPGFVDRKGNWRPATATWAIRQVLQRIQTDWVSLNPPVYPDQPYHVRLAISYHDPRFHVGTIYQQSQATPMYTNKDGAPVVGIAGKFGWCWRLPLPDWGWQDIVIKKPRTMRLF